MRILALESSTDRCSVALWNDGRVGAREAEAGQRNSDVLLPMVDALLAQHGVGAGELTAIAFGSGPGSFTGLRVACGVAQGLAFGAGLPLLGIGTLLAMAEAARARQVVCGLDARMGEIYLAAYRQSATGWIEALTPGLYSPDTAPELPAGGWTACGSGFSAHRAALAARYAGRLERVLDQVAPHAREIAVLAAAGYERGNAVAAELAQPVYVRNKVALRVDER